MVKLVLLKTERLKTERQESAAEKQFKKGINNMMLASKEFEKTSYSNLCMYLFIGALEVAQSLPDLEPKFINRILGR